MRRIETRLRVEGYRVACFRLGYRREADDYDQSADMTATGPEQAELEACRS